MAHRVKSIPLSHDEFGRQIEEKINGLIDDLKPKAKELNTAIRYVENAYGRAASRKLKTRLRRVTGWQTQ